jgi:hypothetical protein
VHVGPNNDSKVRRMIRKIEGRPIGEILRACQKIDQKMKLTDQRQFGDDRALTDENCYSAKNKRDFPMIWLVWRVPSPMLSKGFCPAYAPIGDNMILHRLNRAAGLAVRRTTP